MITKNLLRRTLDLRCGLVVATFALTTPLLGGCVSAVDETSAFGFATNQTAQLPADAEALSNVGDKTPAETAAASEDEATSGEADVKPSDPQALARAAESAAGQKVAEADAAPAPRSDPQAELKTLASSTSDGGIRPTALMSRTSSPAVAAYATPAAAAVKESDHSLYASLFTQSEAKTPLKNADAGKSRRVIVLQTQGSAAPPPGNALPGVDTKSLFEIGQRASVDSELIDDIDTGYQLASLTGIARLAPSGLMVQRDDVVTNCFDSNLMGLISQVEARFKQKVVITSGFRSPAHNRRVSGAKASMHMACKAADLHVPGVNGLEVARFVRALPNRGGVGTYCHTSAIHIDVGSRRDWNWPCRRRQSS